ncbi:ABC-type transport auxiliary lipoprotein family protein [Belnapia sp. F-4-1]|uniref:ABC-type transport auxiliary lipoprotein family protein n=1 Tax=Belnapia sp. F-4-1 TaxID=1545443 RepID=UPI0006898CD2|nr:ABC-type transport auxiliary lipoprotein family protein [Belnapia sp. F-4-1]
MTTRRTVLLLPLLAGCSVLPNRPYQETQRFSLSPERPARATPPRNAPVLLVRSLRAAPGLEGRGLRSLTADGQVATAYWQEWVAPPADAAEEALRRWLLASGRFAAVTQPGSRLRASLVLEGELIRLQAEPAAGRAVAALSILLLAEPPSGPGEARILAQFTAGGSASLPPGLDPRAPGPEAAAALSAALGEALARVEEGLAAAKR